MPSFTAAAEEKKRMRGQNLKVSNAATASYWLFTNGKQLNDCSTGKT
jgi:hypothetical protein